MKDLLIHGLMESVVLKKVSKGVLKGSKWEPGVRMILPHGWVGRNSTKDCVDTSVEITGIKSQ